MRSVAGWKGSENLKDDIKERKRYGDLGPIHILPLICWKDNGTICYQNCRCDLYLHDKATSDKQAISGVELMSDTPLDVVEAMEQAYRTGP
jgi:hypothetical protein